MIAKITPQMIKIGTRLHTDARTHPVAIAISSAYYNRSKLFPEVRIHSSKIVINDYEYKMCPDLAIWIHNFECGDEVEPVRVCVDSYTMYANIQGASHAE